MKIHNSKFSIKSGFTLIEVLVALFLFIILFLVTTAFVNLATGSVKSMRTKILTNETRNAMDIISKQLNNANGMTTNIKGFGTSGNILGVASESGGTTTCTYFGLNSTDHRIYMSNGASCASFPAIASLDRPITSDKVTVSSFTPTVSNVLASKTQNTIPTVKVVVAANDADPKYQNDNKITLQTTYAMNYLTVKKIQAQMP